MATNNNVNKVKVIYGLGGVSDMYRPLSYRVMYEWDDCVADFKYWAKKLRLENPSIQEVYLVDNGPTLRHDYNTAWRRNTIDSYYQFRDTLQSEGIRIC